MTSPIRARLILDEMFSAALASALRDLGHDVIAVTERSDLRAMTDGELFTWAVNERRWLLTENVKDFRPILLRAAQGGTAVTGILFTSSRAFPRSRKNPGPLIHALSSWLMAGPPDSPITEDWPQPSEPVGVGDHIDGSDLARGADRKRKHDLEPACGREHDAHLSVHQRKLRAPSPHRGRDRAAGD